MIFSVAGAEEINELGIDLCIEYSDMGDCTVVNGTTEIEATKQGLKDESESPAVLLVIIFYKEKKHNLSKIVSYTLTKQIIVFLPTIYRDSHE